MTEIAELTGSDTLRLPAEVAARFRRSDRFMVWVEGDAMYLKRIAPRPVTDIVAEALVGEPMQPEEVSDIVHEVRRRRRSG